MKTFAHLFTHLPAPQAATLRISLMILDSQLTVVRQRKPATQQSGTYAAVRSISDQPSASSTRAA